MSDGAGETGRRAKCLRAGFSVRAHIDAIREAVDPSERREFSEGVVRPEGLGDVTWATRGIFDAIRAAINCSSDDAARLDMSAAALQEALAHGDEEAVLNALGDLSLVLGGEPKPEKEE